MKSILSTLLLIGGISAGSLAQAAIHTCAIDTEDRRFATAYLASWRHAVTNTDDLAIESTYAESAVLMPPTDETVVGRDLISDYFHQTRSDLRAGELNIDLVSCEKRGDAFHIAAVWGTEAGDGAWKSGNLLQILERADEGRWVTRYEIWN